MKKWFAIGLAVALLGTGFTFKTWRGSLGYGNRELAKGQTDQAIAAYQEGLVNAPDEPRIHYNLGNAFYEKGDFTQAGEHFKKALDLGMSKDLRPLAQYNLGNALYRQGAALEAEKPEDAVKQYEAALEQYKNAVQADPKDLDAKYNYEFVKKKLDELKDRLKDQQQTNQNKDDKDQQDDSGNQDQKDDRQADDQKTDSKDQNDQQTDSKDQSEQDDHSTDEQDRQNDSQNQDRQDPSQDQEDGRQSNPRNQQADRQTDPGQPSDQQGAEVKDGQGMTEAQALQLLEQFEGQGGQLIPVIPETQDTTRSQKDW